MATSRTGPLGLALPFLPSASSRGLCGPTRPGDPTGGERAPKSLRLQTKTTTNLSDLFSLAFQLLMVCVMCVVLFICSWIPKRLGRSSRGSSAWSTSTAGSTRTGLQKPPRFQPAALSSSGSVSWPTSLVSGSTATGSTPSEMSDSRSKQIKGRHIRLDEFVNVATHAKPTRRLVLQNLLGVVVHWWFILAVGSAPCCSRSVSS